eukprot:TRINITY_DN5776_c1_g1_i1.p1 TRINITY_DN5776_c1_g1~~TRINITY_DN5776_c1_g1_i1.p1  ORF type:complete len:1368 (-),score=253.09 TRINITY_DN5776_c1_g1_i1:854-4957(-)
MRPMPSEMDEIRRSCGLYFDPRMWRAVSILLASESVPDTYAVHSNIIMVMNLAMVHNSDPVLLQSVINILETLRTKFSLSFTPALAMSINLCLFSMENFLQANDFAESQVQAMADDLLSEAVQMTLKVNEGVSQEKKKFVLFVSTLMRPSFLVLEKSRGNKKVCDILQKLFSRVLFPVDSIHEYEHAFTQTNISWAMVAEKHSGATADMQQTWLKDKCCQRYLFSELAICIQNPQTRFSAMHALPTLLEEFTRSYRVYFESLPKQEQIRLMEKFSKIRMSQFIALRDKKGETFKPSTMEPVLEFTFFYELYLLVEPIFRSEQDTDVLDTLLELLEKLMETAERLQVYKPSEDERKSMNEKLSRMTNFLVRSFQKERTRCPGSLKCVTHLMKINLDLLVPHLNALLPLILGFTTETASEAILLTSANFIGECVLCFSKLRQIEVFLHSVLLTVSVRPEISLKMLYLDAVVLNRLVSAVQSAPIGLIPQIWKGMDSESQLAYMPESILCHGENPVGTKFCIFCYYFGSFMNAIQIDAVNSDTILSLCQPLLINFINDHLMSMSKMVLELSSVTIENMTEKERNSVSDYVTGTIYLYRSALSTFIRCYQQTGKSKDFSLITDQLLTPSLPLTSAFCLSEFIAEIERKGISSPQLRYTLVMLMLDRIQHYYIYSPASKVACVEEEQKSLTSTALSWIDSSWKDGAADISGCVWNGSVSQITKANTIAAMWFAVAPQLSVLSDAIGVAGNDVFADVTISTIFAQAPLPTQRISVGEISQNLLQQNWVYELPLFRASIMNAIVHKFMDDVWVIIRKFKMPSILQKMIFQALSKVSQENPYEGLEQLNDIVYKKQSLASDQKVVLSSTEEESVQHVERIGSQIRFLLSLPVSFITDHLRRILISLSVFIDRMVFLHTREFTVYDLRLVSYCRYLVWKFSRITLADNVPYHDLADHYFGTLSSLETDSQTSDEVSEYYFKTAMAIGSIARLAIVSSPTSVGETISSISRRLHDDSQQTAQGKGQVRDLIVTSILENVYILGQSAENKDGMLLILTQLLPLLESLLSRRMDCILMQRDNALSLGIMTSDEIGNLVDSITLVYNTLYLSLKSGNISTLDARTHTLLERMGSAIQLLVLDASRSGALAMNSDRINLQRYLRGMISIYQLLVLSEAEGVDHVMQVFFRALISGLASDSITEDASEVLEAFFQQLLASLSAHHFSAYCDILRKELQVGDNKRVYVALNCLRFVLSKSPARLLQQLSRGFRDMLADVLSLALKVHSMHVSLEHKQQVHLVIFDIIRQVFIFYKDIKVSSPVLGSILVTILSVISIHKYRAESMNETIDAAAFSSHPTDSSTEFGMESMTNFDLLHQVSVVL